MNNELQIFKRQKTDNSLQNDNTDTELSELLTSMPSILGYVNVDVEIEMEEIQGKPEHLSLDDWCEHEQELGCHFKLKKPVYDENNHSISTFYTFKVYEILAQYKLIDDCLNNDCFKKGTTKFVKNGFTRSRKNDGKFYKDLPECKKDEQELHIWVLAMRFLQRNRLAVVHSNGCVYRFVPDYTCEDKSDISNVKLLFLVGSPDSSGYRNFLCLGCHNLSSKYISNKADLFKQHCSKYHSVKCRDTTEESNLFFNVIIAFIVENVASLKFASKEKTYTLSILESLGFTMESFNERNVSKGIIHINKMILQRFVESAVDSSFVPLHLNEDDPNIYNLVTEMTRKIHTFISISEDGWSDGDKNYESIICHLTRSYKLLQANPDKVKADHLNYPLSFKPVKSKKAIDIYQHLSETVNSRIGSFNQISTCCRDNVGDMEDVREMLHTNERLIFIRCLVHVIQSFYKDSLELLTQPPSLSDTKSDDKFLVIVCSMDLSEDEAELIPLITPEIRKDCDTACKIKEQLNAIKDGNAGMSQRELNCFAAIDRIRSYHNELETRVESDNDRSNISNRSASFYTKDYCKQILDRSQPKESLDKFLNQWDSSDYSCGSEYYKKAIEILKDKNYSLENTRNMFRILRKISIDFSESKIEYLNLKSLPKKYVSSKWYSMKEFIEPYLQCNFRPINFYFDDEFSTTPMIPFKYWLSYEDLIFMRILYSHLKELSFLTEFASKDDVSPFLYKKISDFGYFIEKKLMSVLKELGLINGDTFEQFDKNNLVIYQESSSTAIVEFLDLLRVESILKGGSVDYLAALMYQLLIFQSTDNLKIDFDGHFSPKYYNTRSAMTGEGSLSVKTLDLRIKRALRCPPFFDNQVFKRYADKISGIKNTTPSRIIRNDSLGERTTQSHKRHFTKNTTIQSGKDRLLEDCIKAVIEYQSFVKRESKKLQPLINNNLFGEEELENVGIEDLTKLQQKNTLNLIIPSRYIESKKTGIMSYLLKFAQSIAISTASNERTFADLRNSEEEFKSNDELLEAYLHLFMWEREESELPFFKKMSSGLEVRRQRDLNYDMFMDPAGTTKKNRGNTNNNINVNRRSNRNTTNNSNLNNQSSFNTNNNKNNNEESNDNRNNNNNVNNKSNENTNNNSNVNKESNENANNNNNVNNQSDKNINCNNNFNKESNENTNNNTNVNEKSHKNKNSNNNVNKKSNGNTNNNFNKSTHAGNAGNDLSNNL
ncbi:hypothetical protein ACO0SA_003683 [Hanseniaspora valbyensis]